MAVDANEPQPARRRVRHPQQRGEYLLVLQDRLQRFPRMHIEMQSARALFVHDYDIRSRDLSFEMNIAPYRAALFAVGERYERVPSTGTNQDAVLEMDPPMIVAVD